MTILDAITTASPLMVVWAASGAVQSTGGAATPSTAVQVISGLDGQALRLHNADVTVTGVAEFTESREFTLMVWFRGAPGAATRRVVGRQNGATHVTIEVSSNGLPTARVASTTGGYAVSIPGRLRVDDGGWHLIALVARPRRTSGGWSDRGVDLDVWVDGVLSRSGWIDPGLFGMWPDLRMTTPVIIGRAADGAAPVQGDVGPVAAFPRTLSAAEMQLMWGARPSSRGGGTGWGILM